MTTLRDLQYMIEANTDGLNKAFPAIEKLAETLGKLEKSVASFGKNFEKESNKVAAAARKQNQTVATDADKVAAAVKKQEAAIISAQTKMLNLNSRIKSAGGDNRFIEANTKAFQALERILKQTGLTSQQAGAAKAKYNAILAATTRDLKSFSDAQKTLVSSQKTEDAALLKQSNTLERIRIQYLNLDNALREAGAKSERIRALSSAFAELESKLTSGVLDAKQYSEAVNRINSEIARVKRNEGFTDLSSRMTDLAKSAQVALGPLSGVASRITAITSLANRNNIAVAGIVAGIIAYGTSLVKAIQAGQKFERQMLQIEAILEVTGNRIGLTVGQIDEVVNRVAKLTMATKTEIRDAAGSLLTFRNVTKEVYEGALLAAQGLAIIARGDINSQIRNIGRALDDPINNLNTLTESGVHFNAVEQEKIKRLQRSGDLWGAQEEIMKRVNIVAQAAVGEAKGLAGEWKRFNDNFSSFFKTASIGSGALDATTDIVKDLNEVLTETNISIKLAIGLGYSYRLVLQALGAIIGGMLDDLKVFSEFMTRISLIRWTDFGLPEGTGEYFGQFGKALKTAKDTLLPDIIDIMDFFNKGLKTLGVGKELDETIDKLQKFQDVIKSSNSEPLELLKLEDTLQKINERVANAAAKGVVFKIDWEIIGKAEDLVNSGKVKEAIKLLQDSFLVAEKGRRVILSLKEATEKAGEQFTILSRQYGSFFEEQRLAEDLAASFQFTQPGLTTKNWELMKKHLMELDLTAEEAEAELKILHDQVRLGASSVAKYIDETEKAVQSQELDLKITKSVGKAKRDLQIQQRILNALWASGLPITSDLAGSLEALRVKYGALIDTITELAKKQEALDFENMVAGMEKGLADSLAILNEELNVALSSDIERSVVMAEIQQMIEMQNAGIDKSNASWAKQLELVRQIANAEITKQHLEAVKAMRDQAASQDRIAKTLFYSARTRESMLALEEKRYELLQRYGTLQNAQAQKELEMFKILQQREELLRHWQDIANVVDNAFQSLEDSIAEAAQTGILDFRKLANSILADILRMNLKIIMRPFQDWLGSLMGGALGKHLGLDLPSTNGVFGQLGTATNPAWVRIWGAGLDGADPWGGLRKFFGGGTDIASSVAGADPWSDLRTVSGITPNTQEAITKRFEEALATIDFEPALDHILGSSGKGDRLVSGIQQRIEGDFSSLTLEPALDHIIPSQDMIQRAIDNGFEGLTLPFTKDLEAAAKAIRTIESGSAMGNYSALGEWTNTPWGMDRGYGAYQVMGTNVAPWTQKHFGQMLTPEQFLGNKPAQDAVFKGQFFEDYMERFGGMEGAAQAWFGGPGKVGVDLGRTDILGTSVSNYGMRAEKLYEQFLGTSDSLDSLATSAEGVTANFANFGEMLPQANDYLDSVSKNVKDLDLFSGRRASDNIMDLTDSGGITDKLKHLFDTHTSNISYSVSRIKEVLSTPVEFPGFDKMLTKMDEFGEKPFLLNQEKLFSGFEYPDDSRWPDMQPWSPIENDPLNMERLGRIPTTLGGDWEDLGTDFNWSGFQNPMLPLQDNIFFPETFQPTSMPFMGGMGGIGVGGMGMEGMGLQGFTDQLTQATESLTGFSTNITSTVSSLTSSFDMVGSSVEHLGGIALPKVTSGFEVMASDTLAKTIQSQAMTAVQTTQMGTTSLLTSAQVQQLGNSASIASAQLGTMGTFNSGNTLANLAGAFLPGFSSGGFTGNHGTKTPVGVVHGKEFVFDAQDTRRIGIDTLEMIRRDARSNRETNYGGGGSGLRGGNSAGDKQGNAEAVENFLRSLKIINVFDKRIVADYLATAEGEKAVMNVIRRNNR